MEAYSTYFKTLLESWDDLKCTIRNHDTKCMYSDLLIQRGGIYCVMDICMRIYFVRSEQDEPRERDFILWDKACKKEHIQQYEKNLNILLGLLDVSTWSSFFKTILPEAIEVFFGDMKEPKLRKVSWKNWNEIAVWFNYPIEQYQLSIYYRCNGGIVMNVSISEEKAKVIYDLVLAYLIKKEEAAHREVIRFQQYLKDNA